jgi:hypothetical protein
MAEARKYTKEQLANAEELAKMLSELPHEEQSATVMVANAFIAGMEAQARLTKARLEPAS